MRQMINDAKAAKEAEYIRTRGYGLPRQLADEDSDALIKFVVWVMHLLLDTATIALVTFKL